MGKNTNQIATFADLVSIGYRIPSNIDVTSKECVTYQDLVTIGTSTNPQYKVDLGSYNAYQIEKTVNITWENNVKDLHIKGFDSDPDTVIINIGTFTGVKGSCSLTLPILYIKVPESDSTPSTGYFYINYIIKDGDYIVDRGESNKINLDSSGGFYLEGTQINVNNLSSITTYTIGLELRVEYTSNSYYGAYVRIQIDYIYSNEIEVYSPNKCVPWSKIPGSAGQDPSTYSYLTTVSVPVTCYLKEEIDLVPTQANTVTFYYCYRTEENPSLSTSVVGKCKLADGNISESATKTTSVLINPKISGQVVTEDFLRIECGTTGSKQSWYCQCETFSGNNSYSYWASLGDGTYCMIQFPTVSYSEMLRDLKKISFKVD